MVIKGSKTGTSSDVEGRFSIRANNGDVLVVTGVGITAMESTLGDESTISIIVKVDSKNLNEVVVTALGIKKETKRLGYAIQVGGERAFLPSFRDPASRVMAMGALFLCVSSTRCRRRTSIPRTIPMLSRANMEAMMISTRLCG